MNAFNTIRRSLAAAALVLATGLAAGGCQENQSADDQFLPEESPTRASRQIAEAQAASGARADGNLRPTHFEGATLNSLGRAKLDLMLRDAEAAPPVLVYLDLQANDPLAQGRRGAVEAWLLEVGLKAQQYKVEAGPNPTGFHMAAQSMAGLVKMQSATVIGGPGGTPQPGDAAPAK